MTTPTPSVLIDACVPRTAFQRCVDLFDYLVSISEIGPYSDYDPEVAKATVGGLFNPDDIETWYELEDRIVNQINEKLPDDLVCTVGEFQPGDVVVREMGAEDVEVLDQAEKAKS